MQKYAKSPISSKKDGKSKKKPHRIHNKKTQKIRRDVPSFVLILIVLCFITLRLPFIFYKGIELSWLRDRLK